MERIIQSCAKNSMITFVVEDDDVVVVVVVVVIIVEDDAYGRGFGGVLGGGIIVDETTAVPQSTRFINSCCNILSLSSISIVIINAVFGNDDEKGNVVAIICPERLLLLWTSLKKCRSGWAANLITSKDINRSSTTIMRLFDDDEWFSTIKTSSCCRGWWAVFWIIEA